MTTLQLCAFFAFFAVAAASLAIAFAAGCWQLQRQLRRSRANHASLAAAYDSQADLLKSQTSRALELAADVEKWRRRTKAAERSAERYARELQEAKAEVEALRHPPRGERGRFVARKVVG